MVSPEVIELRKQYIEKFGKRPFMAWKEEKLKSMLGLGQTPVMLTKDVEILEVKDDGMKKRLEMLEVEMAKLTTENISLKKIQPVGDWGEYVSPKDRNKTATVKLYKPNADAPEGVIVALKVFENHGWNEETHKYDKLVYTVTCRYDDGSLQEHKIDAMVLAEINQIEQVEIVREDRRTLRKVQQYITVPQRDKDGYTKRELGAGGGYGNAIGNVQVPIEVFKVESTVTVKRQNGQEFQMDSKFLNM